MNIIINCFSLDRRSLALWRIAIGFSCVVDVIYRWADGLVFYTDAGTLPRDVSLQFQYSRFQFSFLMANGQSCFVHCSFILQCYFSCKLILGISTRWTIFALWTLVCSHQMRNILIDNGGDIYLRVLLFWAFLLPVSEVFSYDHFMRSSTGCGSADERPRSASQIRASLGSDDDDDDDHNSDGELPLSHGKPTLKAKLLRTLRSVGDRSQLIASGATLGVLLQLFGIYRSSYLHKVQHDVWSQTFTASFYVFRGQMIPRVWSRLLPHAPLLLQLVTALTLYFEGYALFVVFVPVWRDAALLFASTVVFMLHLSIALSMRLEAVSLWTATLACVLRIVCLVPNCWNGRIAYTCTAGKRTIRISARP
jgi:hypothetical protein